MILLELHNVQNGTVRNSAVQYRTVQYSVLDAAKGLVSEKVVKPVRNVSFIINLVRNVSYLTNSQRITHGFTKGCITVQYSIVQCRNSEIVNA